MTIRDKKFQVALGRHVKKIREEREWSQEQLSAVANIDINQISRIENGVHAPGLHTIKALAIALGKYPFELLRFDFKLDLNTDFRVQHKKEKRPGTTQIIRKLLQGDFFDSPRSVSDVIAHCKKQYHITLKSPAAAGALATLRNAKKIKRAAAPNGGRFIYFK